MGCHLVGEKAVVSVYLWVGGSVASMVAELAASKAVSLVVLSADEWAASMVDA